MTKFIDEFKSVKDILEQYQAPSDALDWAEILIAYYNYANYEGVSFVLFKKEGKLYEVNAGHCFCNGLEGLWSPEETSWAALAKRDFYDNTEAKLAVQELVKANENFT